MTWHGAFLDLARPFADGDGIDDLSQPSLGGATLGLAHLPRCAQVCHQLFLQYATGLNKETSIDRLVRQLHVLVGRELPLQPTGDLLSETSAGTLAGSRLWEPAPDKHRFLFLLQSPGRYPPRIDRPSIALTA